MDSLNEPKKRPAVPPLSPIPLSVRKSLALSPEKPWRLAGHSDTLAVNSTQDELSLNTRNHSDLPQKPRIGKTPVRVELPLIFVEPPKSPDIIASSDRGKIKSSDTDESDSVFFEGEKSRVEKKFYELAKRRRRSSKISNISPPSNFWDLPTETSDETEVGEEVHQLEQKVLTSDSKTAAVALLHLKNIANGKPEAMKLVENLTRMLTPEPKKLPTAVVEPFRSPRTPSFPPPAEKSPVPAPAPDSKIPRPRFLASRSPQLPSPRRLNTSEPAQKAGRTPLGRDHSFLSPYASAEPSPRLVEKSAAGPLKEKNVSSVKPTSLSAKHRPRTRSARGGKENRC